MRPERALELSSTRTNSRIEPLNRSADLQSAYRSKTEIVTPPKADYKSELWFMERGAKYLLLSEIYFGNRSQISR